MGFWGFGVLGFWGRGIELKKASLSISIKTKKGSTFFSGIQKKEAEELSRKLQTNKHGSAAKLLTRISIDSLPSGAELSIDGELIGRCPQSLLLPPRAYRLALRKGGYREISKTVLLEADKDQSIQLPLERKSGTLTVVVKPPGASLSIDGELHGTGGVDKLTLAEGIYQVTSVATGYSPKQLV